ncbi:MAG TPA: hypothetical protein VFZ63_15085 [Jiangellaceae bacterium]
MGVGHGLGRGEIGAYEAHLTARTNRTVERDLRGQPLSEQLADLVADRRQPAGHHGRSPYQRQDATGTNRPPGEVVREQLTVAGQLPGSPGRRWGGHLRLCANDRLACRIPHWVQQRPDHLHRCDAVSDHVVQADEQPDRAIGEPRQQAHFPEWTAAAQRRLVEFST